MRKYNPLEENVIPRAHAVTLMGPQHERRFHTESLRHFRRTVRGMGKVVRAMRCASPEALVLLAGLYERLLLDLQPCSCMVSKRSGTVLGEDDCTVHGFGN